MSFGQELKRVRQSCLLSQEAFAKEIGVSFTTVNRWESGKSVPSYKARQMIDAYCREHGIAFDIGKELLNQ